MKVYIILFTDDEGCAVNLGAFASKSKALCTISKWFDEGERYLNKREFNDSIMIYTNQGEYLIQSMTVQKGE